MVWIETTGFLHPKHDVFRLLSPHRTVSQIQNLKVCCFNDGGTFRYLCRVYQIVLENFAFNQRHWNFQLENNFFVSRLKKRKMKSRSESMLVTFREQG